MAMYLEGNGGGRGGGEVFKRVEYNGSLVSCS